MYQDNAPPGCATSGERLMKPRPNGTSQSLASTLESSGELASSPSDSSSWGETDHSPGYARIACVGSRTVLLRSALRSTSPFLLPPLLVRRLALPAPASRLSVSSRGGGADAPNGAARAAITRLTTSVRSPPGAPKLATDPMEGGRTSITHGMGVWSRHRDSSHDSHTGIRRERRGTRIDHALGSTDASRSPYESRLTRTHAT